MTLKGSPQNQQLLFLHGSPLDYEGTGPSEFSLSPTLQVPSALLSALPPHVHCPHGTAPTMELKCFTWSEQHRGGKGAVTSLLGTPSPHLPINSLMNPTEHARVSLGETWLLGALNPFPGP